MKAEFVNKIEVARAQRDFQLKKATYDQEVNTKVNIFFQFYDVILLFFTLLLINLFFFIFLISFLTPVCEIYLINFKTILLLFGNYFVDILIMITLPLFHYRKPHQS